MVKRIGGFRRKTRFKLQKGVREKGKLKLSRYFQKFETGDKVCLKADPTVQKGMYFPRYHGKTGIVSSKRGFCYDVEIVDGTKKKNLIIHPIHLVKVQ